MDSDSDPEIPSDYDEETKEAIRNSYDLYRLEKANAKEMDLETDLALRRSMLSELEHEEQLEEEFLESNLETDLAVHRSLLSEMEAEELRQIQSRRESGIRISVKRDMVLRHCSLPNNTVVMYEEIRGNLLSVRELECGGGGDCFYYSLAFFLNSIKRPDEPHHDVRSTRKAIVENMRHSLTEMQNRNPDDLLSFLTGFESESTKVNYLARSLEDRIRSVCGTHLRCGIYAIAPVINYALPMLLHHRIAGFKILEKTRTIPNIYTIESSDHNAAAGDLFVVFVNTQRPIQHYRLAYFYDQHGNRSFLFKRSGVFHCREVFC
jgi:hypothetical protein